MIDETFKKLQNILHHKHDQLNLADDGTEDNKGASEKKLLTVKHHEHHKEHHKKANDGENETQVNESMRTLLEAEHAAGEIIARAKQRQKERKNQAALEASQELKQYEDQLKLEVDNYARSFDADSVNLQASSDSKSKEELKEVELMYNENKQRTQEMMLSIICPNVKSSGGNGDCNF